MVSTRLFFWKANVRLSNVTLVPVTIMFTSTNSFHKILALRRFLKRDVKRLVFVVRDSEVLASITSVLHIYAIFVTNTSQKIGLATNLSRLNLNAISIHDLDRSGFRVSNDRQQKAILKRNNAISNLEKTTIKTNTAVAFDKRRSANLIALRVMKRDDRRATRLRFGKQRAIPKLAASRYRVCHIHRRSSSVADDALENLEGLVEIQTTAESCHI
nr:MAG TPA: hypothetical protein [Caudoviricetes sp.]